MTRVHITIDEKTRSSPKAKETLLQTLQERAGLTNVNQRRFERYGVISADVDQQLIPMVAKVPGVRDISTDSAKQQRKAG